MSEMFAEQGTDAWRLERAGKVTASRISDIMAKTKSGYAASRANYAADLIVERLTGKPIVGYVSPAMQYGIDTEAEARAAYEFHTNCDVEQVGFVDHPSIPMAGASPDGLVGAHGLVEFKCPQPAKHLSNLLGASIDAAYALQAQFQMACRPERQWVDLTSYCVAFPEQMRLMCRRVPRDAAMIASLEKDVAAFLAELDDKEAELRSRYLTRAAA